MSTTTSRIGTRRRLLAACAGLLAWPGCGGPKAPSAAGEDKARETLDRALASWQEGKTVAALKDASPSILVSDPRWERGDALKKFQVDGPGKPSGAERAFAVTLWLVDARGKESREQVSFKVGTDPILTVFRSLF